MYIYIYINISIQLYTFNVFTLTMPSLTPPLTLLLEQGPVLVASDQGGMDIEAVAEKNPSAIIKEKVPLIAGLTAPQAFAFAGKVGFTGEVQQKVYVCIIPVLQSWTSDYYY